jgi:hypothetical protein
MDEWTHVGIYVGNDKVVEAFPSGVTISDISTWDYPSKTWVEVLRVPGASEAARNAVVGFVLDQVGDDYDYNLTQKSANPDSDSWYCSELAWAAYMNVRIDIENTPDNFAVSPQEIHEDSDTVYIGSHKEYRPELIPFIIGLFCPAHLIVTDPDGLTISIDSNGIPGAVYIVDDFNGDADADDMVGIPDRKLGDYLINVVPKPGASPTDKYGLEVSSGNSTIVLASDVQISDIPPEGYTFTSTIFSVASYDTNHDGIISKGEALKAVEDYFNLNITKAQVLEVVAAYFN